MNNLIKKLRTVFAPAEPRPGLALIVEPNDRGGWQLRFAGTKTGFGNYATATDAFRKAKFNFDEVIILTEEDVQVEEPQHAIA